MRLLGTIRYGDAEIDTEIDLGNVAGKVVNVGTNDPNVALLAMRCLATKGFGNDGIRPSLATIRDACNVEVDVEGFDTLIYLDIYRDSVSAGDAWLLEKTKHLIKLIRLEHAAEAKNIEADAMSELRNNLASRRAEGATRYFGVLTISASERGFAWLDHTLEVIGIDQWNVYGPGLVLLFARIGYALARTGRSVLLIVEYPDNTANRAQAYVLGRILPVLTAKAAEVGARLGVVTVSDRYEYVVGLEASGKPIETVFLGVSVVGSRIVARTIRSAKTIEPEPHVSTMISLRL